jgi:hypothetical protein
MDMLLYDIIYSTITSCPKDIIDIMFHYDSRCFHALVIDDDSEGKFVVIRSKNLHMYADLCPVEYNESWYCEYFILINNGKCDNFRGKKQCLASGPINVRDLFTCEIDYVINNIKERRYDEDDWLCWRKKSELIDIVSGKYHTDVKKRRELDKIEKDTKQEEFEIWNQYEKALGEVRERSKKRVKLLEE